MSSKIRDALLKADVLVSIATFDEDVNIEEVAKIRSEIKAALDEPVRNCDVGTAEEQVKRFDKFCLFHKCDECQLNNDANFLECGVRWAQLPYEKGETK